LGGSDEKEIWDNFAKAAEEVSREVKSHNAQVRTEKYLKASSDPDGLWNARFEKDGFTPVPPALGDIKTGDTRELFDPESTPLMDHLHIVNANKPTSPKAVVENYDGLLELRRLKNDKRIAEIFKGVNKKDDQRLFEAAMQYQIDGTTDLPLELQVIFNKVTHLYESVAQDAFAGGRIRAIRERSRTAGTW